MVDRSRNLPSFWTLQLLGWGAYTLVYFMAIFRYLKTWEDWVYCSLCILGGFAASLALRALCRRACRRGEPLSRALMRVVLLSSVLAVSSVVLAKCAIDFAFGLNVRWNFFEVWLDISFYACVLISWSALYLGAKHYQAFQVEHERALQAKVRAHEAGIQAIRYELNPHFIFRELDALSTLIAKGNTADADRMLLQLAAYLRARLEAVRAHRLSSNSEIAMTHLEGLEQIESPIAMQTREATDPNLRLRQFEGTAILSSIPRVRARFLTLPKAKGFSPSFWKLQLLGWSAYAAVFFLALFPSITSRVRMVRCLAGLTIAIVATFVLRALCRHALRSNNSWLQAMVQVGLVAGVLAIACAIVSQWAALVSSGLSMTWLDLRGALAALPLLLALPLWSSLYLGIKHYQAFQTEHERAIRAEALAREAQLHALKNQLNPHFLFNTLNAVSTLTIQNNPVAANRMIGQLAAFLRMTLEEGGTAELPLSREVSMTEQYLQIEKARLGERLELQLAIAPEVRDALVPNMLLQPLVENAIRHGIAPATAGGRLTIQANRVDERVQIRITDDGIGMTIRSLEDGAHRDGMGLATTVERLRVLYGDDHRFAVRWPQQGGCQVEIELPIQLT
jgi:two-component system, LytTR family, sensor kinase